MEEFKSNSHKSKAIPPPKKERPKAERVVQEAATVKKRSALRRFADVLIAEDARTVGEYVLNDYIIPGVRTLLHDAAVGGIHKVFGINAKKSDTPVYRATPYARQYQPQNPQPVQNLRRYQYNTDARNYDELIFSNRGDAERVLEVMEEAVAVYGNISILGMYDHAGYDCTDIPHSWDKWGWRNLQSAKVEPTRGGYYIRLPRPVSLE